MRARPAFGGLDGLDALQRGLGDLRIVGGQIPPAALELRVGADSDFVVRQVGVYDDKLGAEVTEPDSEHVGQPFERIVFGGESREPSDYLVGYEGYGLGRQRPRFLVQPPLEAIVHLGVILGIGIADAPELHQSNLDELRGASTIGHLGRPPLH